MTGRAPLALLLGSALALGACPDDDNRTPPVSEARVRAALDRAANALATVDEGALRFDTALALAEVARVHPSDDVTRALAKARARADRDDDNPMRRFYVRDFSRPKEAVQSWTPPTRGQPRPTPNRPVNEALHCDLYGLRPAALAYIIGPMRDDGGYHSTHAAWALSLAKERGCVDDAPFASAAKALATELAAHQPKAAPKDTPGLDLYAERTLMRLVLADAGGPAPGDVDGEVRALLAAQRADGFVRGSEPEPKPVYVQHATAAAAWTLARSLVATRRARARAPR